MSRRICLFAIVAITSCRPVPSPTSAEMSLAVPEKAPSRLLEREQPPDLPWYLHDQPFVMPPAPWVLKRDTPAAAAATTNAISAPQAPTFPTLFRRPLPPRVSCPKGEMAPPAHIPRELDDLSNEEACQSALAAIPYRFIPEGDVPLACVEAWGLPITLPPNVTNSVDASTNTAHYKKRTETDWSEIFGIDDLFRKVACKLQILHWHVPESMPWDEIPQVCKLAYHMTPPAGERIEIERDGKPTFKMLGGQAIANKTWRIRDEGMSQDEKLHDHRFSDQDERNGTVAHEKAAPIDKPTHPESLFPTSHVLGHGRINEITSPFSTGTVNQNATVQLAHEGRMHSNAADRVPISPPSDLRQLPKGEMARLNRLPNSPNHPPLNDCSINRGRSEGA